MCSNVHALEFITQANDYTLLALGLAMFVVSGLLMRKSRKAIARLTTPPQSYSDEARGPRVWHLVVLVVLAVVLWCGSVGAEDIPTVIMVRACTRMFHDMDNGPQYQDDFLTTVHKMRETLVCTKVMEYLAVVAYEAKEKHDRRFNLSCMPEGLSRGEMMRTALDGIAQHRLFWLEPQDAYLEALTLHYRCGC
jgi:hypothetical protein